VVEKVKLETQEEKQHMNNLEQKLKEVFTRIPDSAQVATRNVEEQIQIIAQMLENYKKEIEDLKEKLTPNTPLEVTSEREQQAALQVEIMEKEAQKVTQFLTGPCNYGRRWRKMIGPTIRPTRGGNKHYNPGDKAKTKFHEHYRAVEGRIGDEDPTDIIED
jgi:exonuclease VII large subunit